MTIRWFPWRFGRKDWYIAKTWSRFVSNYFHYLISMWRQNPSKSFLNSGSFIFLWKTNLFHEFFISASVRTLWCKFSDTISKTSTLVWNYSRVFTSSSSWDVRKSKLHFFSETLEVFLNMKLLVTLSWGDIFILEEFNFSSCQ